VQEILSPIYFVLLLVLVRKAVSPAIQPAIPEFPAELVNKYVTPYRLFVSPDTPTTRDLMATVEFFLLGNQEIRYFPTMADAETFYTQNATLEDAHEDDEYLVTGLHFDVENLTYTIRLHHEIIPFTTEKLAEIGA
jgi:hypothetical protein